MAMPLKMIKEDIQVKRIATLLLVIMLALCTVNSALALEWNTEGTIFPLQEKVTFKVLTSGYRSADVREIEKNADWQALEAATNVDIEFVFIGDYDAAETRDNLQMRLLGGDYGDAIWSVYTDTLNTADIQDLALAQMIVPLNKYMEDAAVMPNFNRVVVEGSPAMYTNMKNADGNVNYIAGVTELSAYTAGEALMQINSEWLAAWKAARNVDHSPLTLAEFEDMLYFFRDSDLNGNGLKDEIPYFMTQGTYMGCMTVEHAMGMYGIATKDSTADMNIQISDDGTCYYVHTTDAYKEALKTFNKWYEDGLIWEEVFTGNSETVTGLVGNGATMIGVFNSCDGPAGFEPLMPPAVEGYQARYHMHPSTRLGVRQPNVVITDKCKNPDVLAAFIDMLYFNFDNNMHFVYGSIAERNGTLVKNEEGKYELVTLPEGAQVEAYTVESGTINSFLGNMECYTMANFNMELDSYFGKQVRVAGSQMYYDAGVWNPTENLWPRCTLPEEHATDYAFMYTDVSAVVAEYRAKFVTGEYDIDAKWDEFQQKMVKLGINDMIDIIQKSYDAYVNK